MCRLSRLQRFVLVALVDKEFSAKTQRELNAEIYTLFFNCGNHPEYLPAARASLSRAYRRLESHGFIKRVRGRWELSNDDPFHSGGLIVLQEVMKYQEAEAAKGTTLAPV